MIHRAEHKTGYVIIRTETIRDNSISLEARGLLCYMLAMSDDWKFSIDGLVYTTGLPKCKVMQLVTELKAAGYIAQERPKNERGQFTSCEWTIFEAPQSSTVQKNHTVEKPQYGKTTVWQSHSEDEPQCGKTERISNINHKVISNIKKEQSKEAHGEFSNVLLTPEQFNKLGEQFGTLQRDLVLEELSGYITEHPKKYKDHYITLRNWLLKRKGEQKAQPAPAQTVGVDWAKYYAIADRVERGNR